MTELLTAAQMSAIEFAAIDSGAVTGLELMERAGRGVVEAIFEEWPELSKTSHHTPNRAVVLCGPGNNGGDGFVVARLLQDLGWKVDVFLYGDANKLPPDARKNYECWSKLGHTRKLDLDVYGDLVAPDLVLDALFGTGLARPLPEIVARAINVRMRFKWKNWSKTHFVAVDCPTSLDCDTGTAYQNMVAAKQSSDPDAEPMNMAELTVTFHSPKIGHYLLDGPKICGRVSVVDIGLSGDALERTIPCVMAADFDRVRLLEPAFNGKQLSSGVFPSPMLEKSVWEHKFGNGHALILSGGPAQTGAARLAARGALRIGAGVVTLGVPPAAQMECAMHLTAIMLKRIPDADALAEALKDQRINALCLGPALGLNDRTRALIEVALKSDAAVVLDADALSLFVDAPETLFSLTADSRCVLTPHAGEFARLFPDIAAKLNAPATKGPAYSKVDATRDAAKRAGCVVLFKGPDTVIADPNGRCSINSAQYDRAAPWLATAGSGDVLAGFITGLLARGFNPMMASETAAWLHVECARVFGPGLIAEDLPEQLPKVFRELGV